jgi:hypothetical protein
LLIVSDLEPKRRLDGRDEDVLGDLVIGDVQLSELEKDWQKVSQNVLSRREREDNMKQLDEPRARKVEGIAPEADSVTTPPSASANASAVLHPTGDSPNANGRKSESEDRERKKRERERERERMKAPHVHSAKNNTNDAAIQQAKAADRARELSSAPIARASEKNQSGRSKKSDPHSPGSAAAIETEKRAEEKDKRSSSSPSRHSKTSQHIKITLPRKKSSGPPTPQATSPSTSTPVQESQSPRSSKPLPPLPSSPKPSKTLSPSRALQSPVPKLNYAQDTGLDLDGVSERDAKKLRKDENEKARESHLSERPAHSASYTNDDSNANTNSDSTNDATGACDTYRDRGKGPNTSPVSAEEKEFTAFVEAIYGITAVLHKYAASCSFVFFPLCVGFFSLPILLDSHS